MFDTAFPDTPPVHDFRAVVEFVEDLGHAYWRLRLECPAGRMTGAKPGSFVMVEVPGYELRRPFSLLDVPEADGRIIEVLFKTVGAGTAHLSRLPAGTPVSVLGPLGRCFEPPVDEDAQPVFVGGGFGLAPFRFALRTWHDVNREAVPPILFAGARSVNDLPFIGLLEQAVLGWPGSSLRVTTEDGSMGTTGRITAALLPWLDDAIGEGRKLVLYGCGPHGMLHALAEAGSGRNLQTFLSLEESMACGYGVCNGCVVRCRVPDGQPTRYARICIDGPVFNAADVVV